MLRKSSEEIARILGISKPAVEQRLVSAQRVLGASTREDAALIYAKASGTCDWKQYDPFGDDIFGPVEPQEERSNAIILEEVSMPYDFDAEQGFNAWPQSLKEPKRGWGTAQRIGVIVILTIGILAIILIGLSVSFQSVDGLTN